MYLEILKNKVGSKTYKTYLIRENYRENGKVKHKTIANVSKLPLHTILIIKEMLKKKDNIKDLGFFSDGKSYEYGASYAFLSLAKDIGLDKILFSKKQPWVDNILAMIIGRITYQGSKLSLVNMYNDSALWHLAGHKVGQRPNVDTECYQPMDMLLNRKTKIEKKLAEKHLTNGCIILYDITNIWLEGNYENSVLASFGKSKDSKNGKKIVSLGLLTNEAGCPVGVEIFRGSTSDQKTVLGQIKKLSKKYNLKDIVFTGDRGMLTQKRIDEVNEQNYKTITALTHNQIKKLIEKENFKVSDFNSESINEIFDFEENNIRYILCRDEATMLHERNTRQKMIERVSEELSEKASVKIRRDQIKVSASIGKIVGKYKLEKFFNWNVDKKGTLTWNLNKELIKQEMALDGCYVIRTDVPQNLLSKEQVRIGYRSLQKVEQAFKSIKTVLLELRPVYHKTDDRLKAHIFIVMLAYYVKWHAMQRLQPLFANDGKGKSKRWDFSQVVERLKSIRLNEKLYENEVVGTSISMPDDEQAEILRLLNVDLK